jgi:hypothetical protein
MMVDDFVSQRQAFWRKKVSYFRNASLDAK